MIACWDDAARLLDRKWERVLGEVAPEAQRRVAAALRLPDPAQVTFGPNVHGFLVRLFSCLPRERRVRIVTTDGEFHSLSRQARRWEEAGWAEVVRVPVLPFAGFTARLEAALRADPPADLVYASHVFFDTGLAQHDLGWVKAAPEGALVVIDGYHAFRALPVDLAPVAERTFYLAGGYKYAQAGEGVAFVAVPPGSRVRPVDTGWFAEFDELASLRRGEVGYRSDGGRLAGATFDPAGLYRLVAVERLLEQEGLGPAEVHAHVRALQLRFLDQVQDLGPPWRAGESPILPAGLPWHAHFLAFAVPDAPGFLAALEREGVCADARGSRVRLGFGLYHDEEDADRLAAAVRAVVKGG
jgi:selenocysteine lyase/cysteine desulfurase